MSMQGAAIDEQSLGELVATATRDVSLLVHKEIELAKAEISEKLTRLLRGVVIGIAAGVFAIAGMLYLGDAAAWGIWELFGLDRDFWVGFLIVAILLFVLGAIAGFVAARLFKRASPPTPQMAIEEAQLIRQTVAGETAALPSGNGAERSGAR